MEDHGDNSKSSDSGDSSNGAKASDTDSKAKAPAAVEKPISASASTTKSDPAPEQNIEAEKGQVISLRVVRQATQLNKTEEQESEPAETEPKPARAWAMREEEQTPVPVVTAGPQPAAPAPAQPKTAKPRAPKPETAMPIVSRDDMPGTEATSAALPVRSDLEEESPRSSASSAASRQLEAAMAASRDPLPGESRSDRLEHLSEGLKWSPPRLPVPAIIGLTALTLGAMLVGFLICCSITNVQIDFSDNNAADGTRSRLILSPPFIRFVPKNSTPNILDQTTTAKVEQQPPSNPPTDAEKTSKQAQPQPTRNAQQATDNPSSTQLNNSNNPQQAADSQPADAQSPAQQPQSIKAAPSQATTWQRTSPANPLRPRQAYQMNATPTVVRLRHAYEMKPVPPAVIRHAYRTSDKQPQPH